MEDFLPSLWVLLAFDLIRGGKEEEGKGEHVEVTLRVLMCVLGGGVVGGLGRRLSCFAMTTCLGLGLSAPRSPPLLFCKTLPRD